MTRYKNVSLSLFHHRYCPPMFEKMTLLNKSWNATQLLVKLWLSSHILSPLFFKLSVEQLFDQWHCHQYISGVNQSIIHSCDSPLKCLALLVSSVCSFAVQTFNALQHVRWTNTLADTKLQANLTKTWQNASICHLNGVLCGWGPDTCSSWTNWHTHAGLL